MSDDFLPEEVNAVAANRDVDIVETCNGVVCIELSGFQITLPVRLVFTWPLPSQ